MQFLINRACPANRRSEPGLSLSAQVPNKDAHKPDLGHPVCSNPLHVSACSGANRLNASKLGHGTTLPHDGESTWGSLAGPQLRASNDIKTSISSFLFRDGADYSSRRASNEGLRCRALREQESSGSIPSLFREQGNPELPPFTPFSHNSFPFLFLQPSIQGRQDHNVSAVM